MLNEKETPDYLLTIVATVLFVVLVVYLTVQDSSAVGPL